MSTVSYATTNRSGSPTLWSTYHDLKAVLNAPVIKKRVVNVIYDDSRRIVDMTETFPNLHIGDELILTINSLYSFCIHRIITFCHIHVAGGLQKMRFI